VARAARDVGVRIGFAVALRDRNGIGYCDDATMLDALRPGIRDPRWQERLAVKPVAPAQQLALVDEVAAWSRRTASAATSTCSTGPRPCSGAARRCWKPIARASADTGRKVHMHLLETRTSAPGPTRRIPAASSASSTTSAC
jgi:5-methylthioadenosine/S-adenosylhomocysteine deaminase